ncbi:uncharacterized protein LOC6581359 [Drosophila mojavensis]|uniref:Uncharacterized protein n=1 Tax=Drosophila mojavensis TaxID=7230 RepID=B4KXB2_DROMO|nr:uncharacterized protein LOC6581359 [Drosophila mojavensis]EDW17570.2 uncharacterized protein Dmoj_GI12573 [Drosophila mojavensis]
MVGYLSKYDLLHSYNENIFNKFEVQILRSVTGGENDFKPLPMAVPKQRLIDLKRLYDDIVYPVMKDCSNMPKIEGDILWPWPRNIYTFKMCNFDQGNLPEIMAEGYYKVKCTCEGEVKWIVTYFMRMKTQLI